MEAPLLQMNNIHKRFPGVYALKKVDLDLYRGEVLGLLGENGAGKSTLMKVLSGVYQKDEGRILLDGQEIEITDVKKAQSYGISIIHQELMIVPQMSIAENVFLGREIKSRARLVQRKETLERTQELLDRFEMPLKANQLAVHLTMAQKQMVEIIRAVSFDARIVVMDEPTSSLTDTEVEMLFSLIGKLKQEQVGIVYISHRLTELFQITDRIAVMRDGESVGTKETRATNADEMVSMMVGRELSSYFTKTAHAFGEPVLEVRNLTCPNHFEDVSFTVRKGEILGWSGLVGAGRSQVMKSIFGLLPASQGEILFKGKRVEIRRPQDAIDLGFAFVPESRREEGLILINTVGYNLTTCVLREFIHAGRYSRKREKEIINDLIARLNIITPSDMQRASNLSGGNQQKIVVAKWLAAEPEVLIMDEPTRGIDVATKAEIYAIMDGLSQAGVTIIMVSSELPEILNMSDRVVVMCGGRISAVLEREELSQETIMHYATGGMRQ